MKMPKILIVDDNFNNRLVLRAVLKGMNAELHEASNGLDALSMSLAEDYALILLDVQMPEMDGFEVCEQLRTDAHTANTPIIFLTAAYKNDADKLRGYVSGATDYLAKPIVDHILQAKVHVFLKLYEQQRQLQEQNESLRIAATVFESQVCMMITDANAKILRVNHTFINITGYGTEEVIGKNPHLLSSGRHNAEFYKNMWQCINTSGFWEGEIWNRRKSGEVYPENLTITAVKAEDDQVVNYVASFTDITISKAAMDEIRQLAFYDPLTLLPNRRLLLDRLKHSLAFSARSGRLGALLFIDLDNFKNINDTLGHDKGDLLLYQVAQRLKSCVRECDTVARLGGDEFVVMLEDLKKDPIDAVAQSEMVGENIFAALQLPYQLVGHEYFSTPSIGVTLFNGSDYGIDDLLKQADIAMYQSKKAGRNTIRFFDPKMQDMVNARAALEDDLRKAFERNEFRLYYQGQVDNNYRLLGAEALIRWIHPLRGLINPVQFIPVAEESGLILPIGHWVLETACRQLAAWAVKPETAHLTIAVNISARQFNLPTFVEELAALLAYFQIDPTKLKLEITEGMLLDNMDEIIVKMTLLKSYGIKFSMDDFGTGYSSLQYLKRLPLDQLKIDKTFVHEIAINSSDRAIVYTIIAMAQSLELDIIAEGVETEEQLQLLQAKGCLRYQGYLFNQPLPIDDFEIKFIKNK